MKITDFEQGTTFSITLGERSIALELTDIRPIPASPRPGGGFSLLFRGPGDAALPQAIYSLAGKSGTHDIFIVPVAADATGRVYEAVFN
ncbi:hypothetical protein C7I87_06990 [Mesorhizobium sp. SARCC-RB16n]|uniref:DUF6916 family protein n=1 Tax=Mesorhizobium sp. SARCC-RB16n TaxID=2116687 RepID=UPI00122F4E61|nr:hypothetical protein [Mesorhizobium sp. SARCC-RB16n]KAA3451338.1 hypothetical protein C7I87_06990 [Mesorhizobium sp. SARCC-RB16n]